MALPHSDPRTILMVKAGGAKATHITQFLSRKTKRHIQYRRNSVVIGTKEQGTVVLNMDEHHPYSGITISEWCAANARVMAHLLHTGKLAAADTDYYLAYLAQIFEFCDQYELDTVLQFTVCTGNVNSNTTLSLATFRATCS